MHDIIDDTTPEAEARWARLATRILDPHSPWMVARLAACGVRPEDRRA